MPQHHVSLLTVNIAPKWERVQYLTSKLDCWSKFWMLHGVNVSSSYQRRTTPQRSQFLQWCRFTIAITFKRKQAGGWKWKRLKHTNKNMVKAINMNDSERLKSSRWQKEQLPRALFPSAFIPALIVVQLGCYIFLHSFALGTLCFDQCVLCSAVLYSLEGVLNDLTLSSAWLFPSYL